MSGHSAEKDAAIEAVLALMDGHIERFSNRVYEWPEDEQDLHRNGDWSSFEQRAEAVSRLRAEKIVDAVLACAGAIKADALREAADGLYLSRPGQHNEGARDWLHRRANLIDPRTRDSVCEHGNPKSGDCDYCDELTRPLPPEARA